MTIALALSAVAFAQRASQPDWKAVEPEALRHYQSLIQFDTSASERKEAEYLKEVLDQNGIPAQILFKDPERPNVLARLKGSGKKRPLLLLGHLDTVTVDASKWTIPAVQRDARRRVCLRPRRHRRQGQPERRADGDAAPEAAERAARSRRHPSRRIGRGRRVEPRHRLHDGRALSRDRRRVPASPRAATRSASAARCVTRPCRSPRKWCAASS